MSCYCFQASKVLYFYSGFLLAAQLSLVVVIVSQCIWTNKRRAKIFLPLLPSFAPPSQKWREKNWSTTWQYWVCSFFFPFLGCKWKKFCVYCVICVVCLGGKCRTVKNVHMFAIHGETNGTETFSTVNNITSKHIWAAQTSIYTSFESDPPRAEHNYAYTIIWKYPKFGFCILCFSRKLIIYIKEKLAFMKFMGA